MILRSSLSFKCLLTPVAMQEEEPIPSNPTSSALAHPILGFPVSQEQPMRFILCFPGLVINQIAGLVQRHGSATASLPTTPWPNFGRSLIINRSPSQPSATCLLSRVVSYCCVGITHVVGDAFFSASRPDGQERWIPPRWQNSHSPAQVPNPARRPKAHHRQVVRFWHSHHSWTQPCQRATGRPNVAPTWSGFLPDLNNL